ncbi:MAG: type II toxin-antitoxin system RelE/ParE family toxin [Candidatus Nanoarchaeia archaeon]|nr:type II toxin-antitoxin system RelE/ParE family toxin [Candidatus Nanoarchaeia archaeon]
MVTIFFDENFEKIIRKIKDNLLKEKIKKQIEKIIQNPEIGKPMRYSRINSREVYISPYRLSYLFLKNEDKIIILEFYHKDNQ